MIKGLNHITIAVKDLDRSYTFYQEVLGFKPLMKHSKGAYFLAGDLWFCLELDPMTRTSPLPEYTHFAFSVSVSDFEGMVQRIIKSEAKIWKENKSEGASLYFLDPDGHKLEIHIGNWRTRLTAIHSRPWNESVQLFKSPPFSAEPLFLRRAKEEEFSFLSGLAMRSKSYWPYPFDYLEKCVSALRLTKEDIRLWPVFVAETSAEVVGFFALKNVSGENRLDHLWIDPRFICKGIGSVLFEAAMKEAKNLGWSQFRIAADPYAEAFYVKMGAKKIGSVQSRIKADHFLPHMEMTVP